VQKENPVEITCPANVTVETLEHASFALVNWDAPLATQGGAPLEVTYPQGVASGMPFPFGITDLKVKAVGMLPVGQTGDLPFAECFFTVTVRDPEDPMCDSRKLQCASGAPSGAIKPYAICGGPQLDVTRHADFEATLEYETDGVLNPSYTSCCASELGIAHACVAAAPDSPTMYCKDQGPAPESGPALQSVPVCDGQNDGCPEDGPLQIGDGDCDRDSDCAAGLMCGKDNCMLFHDSEGWPHDAKYAWDMTDDCCYQ
jgi:hypothetical protein